MPFLFVFEDGLKDRETDRGQGMEGLPVVGLLATRDLRPASLGILNEYAGILRGPGLCVLRAESGTGLD